MSFKKGFSLIELMIVVTIMAILAGAAIPYVQDYIEDARRGRCKNDLEEIRNALALFELTRREAYTPTDISKLVGPFLSKALTDPWGSSYVINSASSTCYSLGADQANNTGDEIQVFYRPRMAISRANWIDANLDGLVQVGNDSVHLFCTRPLLGGTILDTNGVVTNFIGTTGLSVLGTQFLTNGDFSADPINRRIASFGVPTVFVPGAGTLTVMPTNAVIDYSLKLPANMALDMNMKIFAP